MRLRRFMAVILSASIIFSTVAPAHATARGIDDQVIEHIVVPFNTMMVRGIESIGDMLDAVQQEGFDFIRNVYDFWSGLIYDGILDYRGFVSELDSKSAHSGTDFADISLSRDIVSATSDGSSMVLSSMGGNTATFVGAADTTIEEEITFAMSEFTWPYLTGQYYLDFSCYPWDFSYYRNYYGMYIGYGLDVYHKTADGYECVSSSNSYHEIPEDTDSLTFRSYRVQPELIQGDTYYVAFRLRPEPHYHYTEFCEFIINSIVVEDVYVGLEYTQPTGVDSSSRTSSLMQAIHTYNTNNSYVDNSTNVNFFLVPSGEDPTEDTVVSPVIYDEETLVYTDPVTGTQYLTNGWTYDYLTRCYTLDMADESYLIGETVIDTIKLTYGDELLTVDHYSGGSLIQSDKYNYVMMSGSACAIDGHTYNVETTKEPTCTAAGERTYTCSVCGNQYVEEITKTDHAYANYEIEQEATCTAPGIASYTCTTCGGQYTDTLPALGHDWQPTAATEESYVMPDNVHCPDCYGSDFTYTRSDYEILTGKNLFNFPERSFIYTGEVDSKNFRQFDSNSAYVGLSSNNYFNNSKIYSFEYDSDLCSFDVSAAGGYGVGFPFALTPGKQYSLSAVVTSDSLVCISFYDSEGKILSWSGTNYINATFTVPDDAYWTVLVFRDCNDSNGISASYSQVQLEKGSEITEYEPYTTKEIEIIPPIYTFTCFDCSTVWTKEAEYQGATVTYTCTCCHETRTEASGEEAGLFHSIGNLIADGITWATDKMTQLVDSIAGLNSIFTDFAESVKNSAGQYPAFLGAVIALLPEDLMNVFWFGIVALIIIAVWKKWFS